MKNFNFNQLLMSYNEKQTPHRFGRYTAMLLMVLSLSVGQMWAYNEYNKKYLYINATNCSWYTTDDCKPTLDIFDDYDHNTWKAYQETPTGTITSGVWYYDLSSFYTYYLYSRAFGTKRHVGSYWSDELYVGYIDQSTYNCLWINDDNTSVSLGYYAVPISSIALAGSGANIISGSGTSASPYLVAVGNTITLTATPTYTPADNTMSFCANFGTSPASNPTTVQNSTTYTVSSTSKVELKCVGRNKYGDVYSSDVTSSSVYVQGVPSYTLTYSVGDVAGNDGSITSSPSTASGSSVQSGNTVTLTAPSAKTGYTWKGWYGNSDGSGAQLCSTAAYAITVSDNTTVYACYTENDYTVTVAASSGGSVASTSVTGHKDTKVTLPTATANTGYYFTGWTTTSGYATYTNQYSATSAQVNGLTAAATVTANFAPIWTIAGSDELGEWDANTNTLWQTYVDATVNYAYFDITTLEPNKDYTFKVVQRSQGDYVWWRAETDAEETINYGNSNTRLNIVDSDGDNFTMHTAGKGTYTFDINLDNNKHPIKVHYPTSYTVTFGYGTGGSAVSATVEDATTITTGQYAAEGKDVTFTQTPTTGYTFKGWYDASSGGSAISSMTSDNVYDDIAANINVYAQYTENMTTVTLAHTGNGHIEIGGATVTETTAGVATTRTITAVPDAGYYFAGWVVSDGSDCTVASTAGRDDNESSSTTLTGSGAGTTGTVTANFVECEKIYFRDIFDDGSTVTHWGDVYVNLGITWNGSNQAITNSTNASWRVHMTQITGTNVWWAYVPRNYTVSSNKNVGFSKDNQNDLSYTFYNTKAATRGDYNKALNMFVPYHTAKTTGNNSVDYFDNGYWMKYDTKADQGAGYYLKQYNSRNDYTQKGEFTANTDDATTIQFQVRIDESNTTKKYMITSAGGLNYLASSAVTSANNSSIALNEDTRATDSYDVYFELTTASEGMYTFLIDQTEDKMKLTVLYPVAVGDYRLKHEYTDGSAKASYSDIIKSTEISGKTVSMYLNMDAATKSLKLEKCTSISAGVPVWGSNTTVGTGTGLFNTTTFNKGKGVYKFDVVISSNAVSSISNAEEYTGDFYIKTNCADGGWANYKQNVMPKNTVNFSKSNANTFDYYFCRYTSAGTNVKFVIANDYNNAVSDTIVQDATYLTTAGGGSSKEFLPANANIRFSYNSATNEAKRAFINGSATEEYLNIIPDAASKVYLTDGTTDLYGASKTNQKFGDEGNWIYSKEVKVVPNGTAGVTAKYNGNTQQLIAAGTTLMGSSNDASEKYKIRVVYDFKTNNLMTAWVPDGDVTDALTGVEFMYIREGQGTATQITFNSGSLNTINKVYGVFQFDYDDYKNKVGSWPQQAGQSAGYTYQQCMFYFSFPFDVKVSDIFGIGTYGTEWIIQYYDGAERASKGFFRGDGTTTFWKNMPISGTLEANVGYSLLLDNDYFNGTTGNVWENKSAGSSVYLYFPSSSSVSSIDNGSKTITVPEHECKIDRTWGTPSKNHKYTDSHWNMMGVPLFTDTTGNFSSTFKATEDYPAFGYLYAWNSSSNTLSIASTTSFTFKAMYAYMVQYAGTVTFSGSRIPDAVAAPRRAQSQNYTLELQVLNSDEEMLNHTYVELRDEACDTFALNEDVYMSLNNKAVNIYTFAGNYDVAANVLSVNNHTVPVGVVVKTAGTYTFSMPSNFSGTVTLIDNFTNTRTNLAVEDYEVSLEKGTIDDRFELEININNMPTAIDGVSGDGSLKDGKAHKFIMNDQLYILRNGVVYDARGARVK